MYTPKMHTPKLCTRKLSHIEFLKSSKLSQKCTALLLSSLSSYEKERYVHFRDVSKLMEFVTCINWCDSVSVCIISASAFSDNAFSACAFYAFLFAVCAFSACVFFAFPFSSFIIELNKV